MIHIIKLLSHNVKYKLQSKTNVPGSRDEGSKTIATPFVIHFPYVLFFGLLFSLFLCLLCSLFCSPFAPFVPVFLSVCYVPSGILLSSYTWVFIPSLPCLSSPLVPSVFVSILSFVFQFILSFSWFSSFFCGLLLECSIFGAVAAEDGDLCKGVPAIGWRLISVEENNSRSLQVAVVASWRLPCSSTMVDEEWYYGCACGEWPGSPCGILVGWLIYHDNGLWTGAVTSWSYCHGEKRIGAAPIETWRNWPHGRRSCDLRWWINDL